MHVVLHGKMVETLQQGERIKPSAKYDSSGHLLHFQLNEENHPTTMSLILCYFKSMTIFYMVIDLEHIHLLNAK